MDYTQLITRTLAKIGMAAEDVYSLTLNMETRTVTVLSRAYAKYVITFPDDLPVDDGEPAQKPAPRKTGKRGGL